MSPLRMFSGVVMVAAVWVVVVAPSAQAACSGRSTPDSFEFSCSSPSNESDPSATETGFSITFGMGDAILSGSVTSPAGFSCEAHPPGTNRLGHPVYSYLSCTAPASSTAVAAGQKVTGAWQLSSPSVCTRMGNSLQAWSSQDAGDSLNCAAGTGGPGTGGAGGNPAAARCAVPKLKGKRLAAAKTLLAKAHCRVGKITSKKGPQRSRGRVVGQTPGQGAVKPAGSKVALVIGK